MEELAEERLVVRAALDAGHAAAEALQGKPVVHVLPRCDDRSWPAIEASAEYNPLIQQDVVHFPQRDSSSELNLTSDRSNQEESTLATPSTSDALGFIETQGFTAVFDAIDSACKAANVEVVGKEKLGGGYITVVVRGDVAAVKAAVEAGSENVAKLGTLIATHVIARPSANVLKLLPQG